MAIVDFLPTTRDEIILFEGQAETDSLDLERRGIVGPVRKITLRALKSPSERCKTLWPRFANSRAEFDREGVAGIIVQ